MNRPVKFAVAAAMRGEAVTIVGRDAGVYRVASAARRLVREAGGDMGLIRVRLA